MTRMRGIMVVGALLVATPVRADDVAPLPDDTFVAVAMSGPAASIKAACLAADPGDHAEGFTCTEKKLGKRVKARAPFKKLGRVQRRSAGFVEEMLAIQTDAGWYVTSLMMLGTDYGGRGTVTISSIKIKDVIPGGAPEVIIVGKRKESYESNSYARYGETRELLWVCGVGGSGTPSCAEVTVGRDQTPSDSAEGETTRFKFRLGFRFEADGTLTRTVKGKWPRNARVLETEQPLARADHENTRPFLFP